MKRFIHLIVLLITPVPFFAQTTAIPDAAFEQALVDQGIDSNGMTGDILNSDAAGVPLLYVNGAGISDLTGIEAFVDLTYLEAMSNQISSVDFSILSELQQVRLWNNALSSIDISSNPVLWQLELGNNLISDLNDITGGNTSMMILNLDNFLTGANFNTITIADLSVYPNLEQFYCRDNGINSINVSSNPAMRYLRCSVNDLNSIDVSSNPQLRELSVNSNLITSLNVSLNPLLETLDLSSSNCCPNYNQVTSIDLSNNPNLTTLRCDANQMPSIDLSANNDLVTLSASENLFTSIDLTTHPLLEFISVASNQLSSVDLSQNSALIELHISTNPLASIDLTYNTQLVRLFSDDNGLSILDLTTNLQLKKVWCSNNQLSQLEVGHLDLQQLICTDNSISTLDINHPSLQILHCSDNQITSIDVSASSGMIRFDAHNNALQSLNIQNGNNFLMFQIFNAGAMVATGNPDLNCIQVDDPVFATDNFTQIDPWTSYALDCSTVGLEEIVTSSIQVFPNPVADILRFDIQNGTIDAALIYDQIGGEILSFDLSNGRSSVSVNTLPSGVYVLHLINDGEVQVVERIIKL